MCNILLNNGRHKQIALNHQMEIYEKFLRNAGAFRNKARIGRLGLLLEKNGVTLFEVIPSSSPEIHEVLPGFQ